MFGYGQYTFPRISSENGFYSITQFVCVCVCVCVVTVLLPNVFFSFQTGRIPNRETHADKNVR